MKKIISMNKIYDGIAKEFGVTPEMAKKEIEKAIEITWQSGTAQNKVPYKGDIPTNEEFLSYILDRMRK